MKAVGILSIFLGFMTLQVLAAPVNDLPAVGDLSAVEDHYGYDDNIHVTEPDVLTSSEEENSDEKNPDERTA
ncbi:hypothetical protein FRC02_004583 [Tulasnella sp. 418]|nr:hypothetical protein FRC02_004583 [Tulasnella sp. 418]